jgi:ABC-2 type transport system ATP-binding protein
MLQASQSSTGVSNGIGASLGIPVIALTHVSKCFGKNSVLDDVSLEVLPGEIVGFVGANGSGKTTTMRAIMGLIKIDHGVIQIENQQMSSEARQNRLLGYMPEERGLYVKQSVLSQLRFFGELQGVEKKTLDDRIDHLLTRLGIEKYRARNLGDLSLGNQQRVQLAVAILHKPRYFLLDEPFSGLDPLGVEALIQILREEAKNGVGILFSSHVLPYVTEISKRVLVLNRGRIHSYVESPLSLPEFYQTLASKNGP